MKIFSSKDRAARPRSASLWSYAGLVGLTGVAALAVTAGLIFGILLPGARDALETQARETHGRAYAAVFDGRLRELRRWLGAAAASPLVREALANGDAEAIGRAGTLLNGVLEFAERVEVYRPGTAALDLDAEVPISYAALDVIKRAQEGKFVGPEAIEGGHRAIYAAHPVEIDGNVAGVVFAVVNPRFFLDPLAGFDPANGRLTLEQAFDAQHPITVLRWGEAGTAAAPQRFDLRAPHWSLVYEAGQTGLPAALGEGSARNALLGALAVFAAGLIATFLRLAGNVRHDARLLGERLAHRAPTAAPAFRLAAFAGIATELAGPIPQEGGSPTETPEPAPDALLLPLAELAEPESPSETPAGLPVPPSEPEAAATAAANAAIAAAAGGPRVQVDPDIFRAYDIHGSTTRNFTDDIAYWIGRAFAAEARACEQGRVAVGRDGRNSSPALASALIRGLTEGGANVVDIGQAPTPVLYFATHALETGTGIMVTGSHDAPEFNGLRMILAGETLAEARIQALRQRIEQNQLSEGSGRIETIDLREAYLDRIVSDVVVAQPLRVVVDCGNGAAGTIAPELISRLDCDVIPLYCDVDGSFPNHLPDPADPHNLEDLITVVKAEQADIGLAFDGDGDRIGVVTASGRIIWPDHLLMLFAQDIVGRNPGADIIYDVECSRHLNTVVSELGGRPIMWKTGHSNIQAKLRETGALLGGEFSGHICFGERWYGFADALYAAARLLEILGAAHEPADTLFGQFPRTVATPTLRVPTTDRARFVILDRLATEADFGAGTLTTIDGVRVDYEDGWGLIRASNTGPALTLRFEADDAEALERIQAIFAAQLTRIDPDLKFR